MNAIPEPQAPLFLLHVAATKVGNVLAAALAGTRLTVEDAVVLNQIDALEPVTPAALAARLGVSPSTLTYRLQSLEQRRLVRRARNPQDGRSALLSLSAIGRRRWQHVLPLWLDALRHIERGLEIPAADVVAALRAVATAADRALAERPRAARA